MINVGYKLTESLSVLILFIHYVVSSSFELLTYSMELKRICTEDMYTSCPGAFQMHLCIFPFPSFIHYWMKLMNKPYNNLQALWHQIFLVFTDLKFSSRHMVIMAGLIWTVRKTLYYTGNDATFAPLVGKMVFLLDCSFI